MTVQDEVRQRIENDALLARLRRKIESGKGTFADSFAYSDRAGKLLGDIFSRRLPDIPLEEREALCVELLRDRYTDINELCDRVQKALDEAQGLHLAPQHAPFNGERAHQIGSSLRDLSKHVEILQRRAESAPATATRAMHDDRMKAESKFRSRAGLKCTVNRVAASECCEWCDRVAGKYEYDDTPDDLWRRHDNCKCSIVYGTRRNRQVLRGTEKKWEVVADGVGAPEPVRLTPEQAAKLQEKHLPKVLTKGTKNVTIKAEGTPEELFDRKLHLFSHQDDLSAVNPHFSDSEEYKENCFKCVAAYVLRRRGFNVEALPFNNGFYIDEMIAKSPSIIWKKGGSHVSAIRALDSKYFGKPEIIEAMRHLPDGTMFEVRCEWKSGGAHVFIAEKIDGRTKFIDPQNGESDVSYYFSDMKKNRTSYWRIDDAKLDEDLIEYCCVTKGAD